MNYQNELQKLIDLTTFPIDKYKELRFFLDKFRLNPKPSKEELNQLLEVLYPLFLKPQPMYDIEHQNEWSVYWKAERLFNQILYDNDKRAREWIKSCWYWAKKRGENLQQFLQNQTGDSNLIAVSSTNAELVFEQIYRYFDYQNAITIPFNRAEANLAFKPFYDYRQLEMKQSQQHHLKLFWNIFIEAQSIMQQSFEDWVMVLEKENILENHFVSHIHVALKNNYKYVSDYLSETATLNDFNEWINQLDHINIMVQASAAKCIGSLYFMEEDEVNFNVQELYSMKEIMHLMQAKQIMGKKVCGGFVTGATDSGGLWELQHKNDWVLKEKINVRDWTLETACNSPEDIEYNPAAQAFWFYIHEYFDFDTEAVDQLIDTDRLFTAWMCITESIGYGSFEKMKPELKRIANGNYGDYTEQAKKILTEHNK